MLIIWPTSVAPLLPFIELLIERHPHPGTSPIGVGYWVARRRVVSEKLPEGKRHSLHARNHVAEVERLKMGRFRFRVTERGSSTPHAGSAYGTTYLRSEAYDATLVFGTLVLAVLVIK